jgi:sialate O-acetylesterase
MIRTLEQSSGWSSIIRSPLPEYQERGNLERRPTTLATAIVGILCLALVCATPVAAVPLKMALVFGDSMVLQRNMAVPIWGTAQAGADVTVTFADQHLNTRADTAGHWRVTLDAMPASADPRDLTVASDTTIRLHDLLVGEVWVAAGQSNMEFSLSRELHAAMEIPAADLPAVRLLDLSFAGQYVYGKRFDPAILARLTPQRFYEGTWKRCSPKSAPPFSAIAYYFARNLQQQLHVPIGMINLSVGGSPTEAWIRRGAMDSDPQLSSLTFGNWLNTPPVDDWCKQRGRENLGPIASDGDPTGPNHAFKPGFLWDAGIARLLPFSIRGVIWYQGESNSLNEARTQQHEPLFRTLVLDWRKSWGLGEFPFLYCQLSGIGTASYKSQCWPEFRDQQRRMLAEIPETAMAVTSDFGNETDVHPREKREIANRLSSAAMVLSYGAKQEWEGPLVDSVKLNNSRLIVKFSHADSGLTTSDQRPVRGFEIAGKDGRFFDAEASIEASTLHLQSSQVPRPALARYDWRPYPDGNLVNNDRFPCSTFTIGLPESSNVH